jgi:hypothetical protein
VNLEQSDEQYAFRDSLDKLLGDQAGDALLKPVWDGSLEPAAALQRRLGDL